MTSSFYTPFPQHCVPRFLYKLGSHFSYCLGPYFKLFLPSCWRVLGVALMRTHLMYQRCETILANLRERENDAKKLVPKKEHLVTFLALWDMYLFKREKQAHTYMLLLNAYNGARLSTCLPGAL